MKHGGQICDEFVAKAVKRVLGVNVNIYFDFKIVNTRFTIIIFTFIIVLFIKNRSKLPEDSCIFD